MIVGGSIAPCGRFHHESKSHVGHVSNVPVQRASPTCQFRKRSAYLEFNRVEFRHVEFRHTEKVFHASRPRRCLFARVLGADWVSVTVRVNCLSKERLGLRQQGYRSPRDELQSQQTELNSTDLTVPTKLVEHVSNVLETP